MRKITIVLTIMLFASLLVFSGCTRDAGEAEGTIKIGVIGPMNFTQGEGHWNGAVMAAEEINADGGI
jgi:branched-chain amino acid transport system substrate-binding protein